ncbi:MAG: hypothetical protein QOH47_2526 [Sphingomonadales bacterium]|jgi:DNA phosphorothioation-associated putative methyltransferase|nr:hypothetical protein [Sphingomonadales bacterium]
MSSAAIERHRTAMVRHTLSKPMSLLVQHSIVKPGVEVFDYGCGQGDDLRALAAAGVQASGWDPHFAPDAERSMADVVNLGFVLNVIEEEAERREALRRAWALTRKVLSVATMVAGQVPTDGLRSYRDGFLTSRGTFQKYFQHIELRALIADTLGADPLSVAPGTFLVFREPEQQEEFLLRRRMGRRISTSAYRSQREGRRSPTGGQALCERLAPLLGAIAQMALMRGRMPHAEEIPSEIGEVLAQEHVSAQRAFALCLESALDSSELDAAAAAMREDLMVHYALGRLNRSRTADRPSPAMIRDIRAHFGSQRELLAASTDYLMGLADQGRVAQSIRVAAEAGIGAIDHRERLVLDARRREELPGVLRVYLGCAAYLAGEPDDESLVRIDPGAKRVGYFPIEARSAHFPETTSSLFIDLRRQSVAASPVRRVLIGKSRVLGVGGAPQRAREDSCRVEQKLGPLVILSKVL